MVKYFLLLILSILIFFFKKNTKHSFHCHKSTNTEFIPQKNSKNLHWIIFYPNLLIIKREDKFNKLIGHFITLFISMFTLALGFHLS